MYNYANSERTMSNPGMEKGFLYAKSTTVHGSVA
jgi:hypothetical protein